MNNSKLESRRGFLRLTGLTVAAGVIGSKILAAQAHAQGAAKPAGKLEMIKPSDSQAQALGYVEDAAKVDTKKFPKHAGAEGAKQHCYNCQFFQAKTADPKSEDAAPCQIFALKGVKSKGWCNSWVQNPKVKG